MEIRSYKVAHQGKERCDGESFVSFADDLVVCGMPIKPEREESGCRVYWHHKQDPNDTATS